MDLFKYSFNEIFEINASDDSVKLPIKGSRNKKHNGRTGSYVTPYRSYQNYSSQYKLSITYSPNFRYKLDVNALQHNRITFLDDKQKDLGPFSKLDTGKLPRVWPAFGYFGGAREIFVEFKSDIKLKIERQFYEFKIPGRMDFYHSDDDEEVKGQFISNFEQNIPRLLGDAVTDEEDLPAKINQSVGIAVNVKNYDHCDFNLTASIAYKELAGDCFVKCWLNAWKDDDSSKRRYIYNIQEEKYLFKWQSLRSLVSISDFTLNVFKPLYSAFNNILNSKGCFTNSLFYVTLP
ncbi:MAG: hypothetical protein QXU18_07355 [Thermoplasmatales archaeon]